MNLYLLPLDLAYTPSTNFLEWLHYNDKKIIPQAWAPDLFTGIRTLSLAMTLSNVENNGSP